MSKNSWVKKLAEMQMVYLFVVDTVDVVHFLQTSSVRWGKSLENKQSLA